MQTKSLMLTLKGVQHWINIDYESNRTSKADDYEYDDDEDSNLIVVWESVVQPLTDVQRLIFLAMTIIVTIVAICGNILVLYVNISRFLSPLKQFQR
jgi:hypothetical protein